MLGNQKIKSMKKLLRNFALVVVAAVGVMSCAESDLFEEIENLTIVESSGVTLYATAGTTDSKVSFESNDSEGIDLQWEEGDEFTLYYGESLVGTFVCNDASSGAFTCSDSSVSLTDGAEYTAKYNEDADTAEQDGDAIANLDVACQMEATFTYEEGVTLHFTHNKAIMTFVFASDERPSKLIFVNGDQATYTVNYSEIEPSAIDGVDYYTSYIMIDPCEEGERELVFMLFDEDVCVYDYRAVTTSKAYVKGVRYIAGTSTLNNTIWSGSGAEDDPYKISTAEELRMLSTCVNNGSGCIGKYFEMTCDIDLGGIDENGDGIEANEFTAIGDYSNSFCGIFDGGGYEVSGLYVNQPEAYHGGLFGYISGATIANVGVSGSVTTYRSAAGVVGFAVYSYITSCCSSAKVTSINGYVGGVVGWAQYSSVANSYNTGAVTGSTSVGGVVGYFCGYDNSSQCVISNCYNTGEVKGTGTCVGGVAGKVYKASIANCYNKGNVTGSQYTGGIAGAHWAMSASSHSMINSYNLGTVSGYDSVGGVVGSLSYYTTLDSCYAVAEVTATSGDEGGVIGSITSGCIANNCYHNSDYYSGDAVGDIYGTSTITNTDAKSDSEMKEEAFVALLNSSQSDEPWEYDSSAVNLGYPVINWQGGTDINPVDLEDTPLVDFRDGNDAW